MNRGQIPMGIGVVISGITMVGAVLASYFTTLNTQTAKIADAKAEVVSQLNTETLERTTADAQMQGELDQINSKLDLIISGLGLKFSLPQKQENVVK